MSQKHKIKDRQVFIKKEPLQVPEFRCIININTNIYEEKRRCRRHRSHSKTRQCKKSCRQSEIKNKKSAVKIKDSFCRSEIKNKTSAFKIEDRIVPLCFRDRRCNGGRSSFLNISDNTLSKRSKTKSDRYYCKCRRHHKKDKREKLEKKVKKTEDSYLSPISSLELIDSEISLDNISSDTVDSDFEINMLIQRTKKLEKHTDIFQLKPETFAQCSPDRFMTRTPCENQNIIHNSETDVDSIHSVTTVKLENTSLKNRSWHSNETINILSIYDQDETLVFMNETENIEIKKELKYSPSNTSSKTEQLSSMPVLNTKPEINVKVEEDENRNHFCGIKQEVYSTCTEWFQ